MEGSILSTYMFGILVLLLIIVIIVMYYLWNETKKNKNTITMLESDLDALRSRLEKNSKHIEQLESFEMPGGEAMGMGKGGPSKMMQQQHILEQLMGGLGMRDFMQTGEDEEYESGEDEDEDESGEDEEYESGEDEDEDESGEDEDMPGDSSGSDSEYETVDESVSEECDACGSYHDEDAESTEHVELPDMSGNANGSEFTSEEPVPDNTSGSEPSFVPVITPEMDDRINNLLGELNVDGTNNKKFPAKTPSECEVGVVMKGGDSKDYVVSLNKRGGKYWKPLK